MTQTKRHIKVPVHSAFYQWARGWVTDKTVLDVGCGEGYGTAILAQSARHVTGMDIDAEQIAETQQRYPLANVSFVVGDGQATGLPAQQFDVVVCNALLEYLIDPDEFFGEAWRLLKPGGVFICSTKNANLSLKKSDGSPLYPDHRQEFSPEQLQRVIGARYQSVELFGVQTKARSQNFILDQRALRIEGLLVRFNVKHLIPLSWRNYVRSRLTGVNEAEIMADDFEIVGEDLDEAFYIVGVGHKV